MYGFAIALLNVSQSRWVHMSSPGGIAAVVEVIIFVSCDMWEQFFRQASLALAR